jgi:uncharacterized protein YbjT (DUF2867 family)
MNSSAFSSEGRVLICGATGFVGSRLLTELIDKGIRLRILVRDKAKVRDISSRHSDVEVFQGDLLSGKGLEEALHGIHSAYSLVHSMGGKSIFRNVEYAEKDKSAARHFVSVANKEDLKRVIYLGGLGEVRDGER